MLQNIFRDILASKKDSVFLYYCTCKKGSRTLGRSAHVAAVPWYLRYVQHQDNVPKLSIAAVPANHTKCRGG